MEPQAREMAGTDRQEANVNAAGRKHILIIAENKSDPAPWERDLREANYDVSLVGSTFDAVQQFRNSWPDLVLLDIDGSFYGHDIRECVNALRIAFPDPVLFVVTEWSASSIDAIVSGATMSVKRPLEGPVLLTILGRIFETAPSSACRPHPCPPGQQQQQPTRFPA